MRIILMTLGVLFVQLAVGTIAAAENERAGPEEVLRKVREAVALLERDGRAALSVIADPSAGFMWKDTYVFVVDCEADRVMANAAFPERVGGDIKQHTDYAGRRYGLELCDKAARPGGGWIEYVWLRPGGNTPLRKISFVTSAVDMGYQVGAGIYDQATPLADLEAVSQAGRNLAERTDAE